MNVVLVEPEIPQNTGNIARLCAATKTTLHLVHPLGFSLDDKYLKRAGLDYWPFVRIVHHIDFETYLKNTNAPKIFFSTHGEKIYTFAPYSHDCHLIFGKESIGLPKKILQDFKEFVFKIPIWGNVRSLNLATSVGIVLYEGYRQLKYF